MSGSGSGSGVRKQRIAGAIRKHLGAEFSREVADPRLFALSVSSVELTADLSIAKVSVRLMIGGEDPQARQAAMATLGRIAPGLRSSLAPVLRMRRVPELRFFYDEALDKNAAIEDVLRDIEREDAQKRRKLSAKGTAPDPSEPDTDSSD